VNDAGEIVGWAQVSGGQQHAFLWTTGSGMVDLSAWPNGCSGSSQALGINDAGIIVGTCDGRPVLWTAVEGMRPLPLPSGISVGEPQAINGENEVVGIFNGFGAALWTVANEAPVAAANGPYTGAIGSAIAFSSAGSSDPDGDPLAYAWDFGDGGTAAGTSVSHAYEEAGNYTATLTVTDPAGAADVATTTVTISKATPAIVWSTPGSIILGTPYGAVLSATATGVSGATLAGTFTYRNAAGVAVTSTTVPGVGENQTLSVDFAPSDQAHYTNASASIQLSVLYDFTGFFQPVDNKPVLNAVNAGQGIPVKFMLGGDRGLDVFQQGSPASGSYACAAASEDVIEETVTATTSALSYSPSTGQYTYVWKSEKSWASSCRKLVLTFKDGSRHEALFHFKK